MNKKLIVVAFIILLTSGAYYVINKKVKSAPIPAPPGGYFKRDVTMKYVCENGKKVSVRYVGKVGSIDEEQQALLLTENSANEIILNGSRSTNSFVGRNTNFEIKIIDMPEKNIEIFENGTTTHYRCAVIE